MKNNKGFTLVELLAVVVLIGVLSVVAVSTYRGINESSKKKALEAKITQINSAAEKWGRENNITYRTTISVNALVVEGYITADEVKPDGLATIKNPVNGENMICNTVNLSFKNGVITSNFNSNDKNCDLATQSLIDNNINIMIKSANNADLTGNTSSSIAKWTNQDIVIIVNSTEYDPKATAISYDFEGNTVTKSKSELQKYTGNSYINATQAANYYNVFHIKSELILNSKVVVTYDIPGEGTKSRAYTIRFDKEEATATLKANSEWITSETPVTIMVDDGKGSGPKKFYMTTTTSFNDPNRKEYTADNKGTTTDELKVGKYYIWTEDNAGNISHTYKIILEINNVDDFVPDCEVLFHGTKGQGHWYKEDAVTPGGRNVKPAGTSGVNIGVSDNPNNKVYTAFAAYGTNNEGLGEPRTTNTTRAGQPYYCHAKTLAGNYGTATETLWLDRTPPTVTVNTITDPTYTKIKAVTVTVTDNLSGLDGKTEIKYNWSLGPNPPTAVWSTTAFFTPNAGNEFTTTLSAIGGGPNMTGIYYLWIDASDVHDYAGNYATSVNGQGTLAMFGPFMFDNTPPACGPNNGKTNWTNGTYNILQQCHDDTGTTDQSGCVEDVYVIPYSQTDNVKSDSTVISDHAGNTNTCDYNVYLEHIKPSCELHEPEGGPDGDNGWYKSASVVIIGTFQDNGAPGLQSGRGAFGTARLPNSVAGATSVTISENGENLTAWCYIRDHAGNEGANSITIKKDDGSEAQAGGCSAFGGNSTWKNTDGVPIGVRLNTHPISGCTAKSVGGDISGAGASVWSADCDYNYSFYLSSTQEYTFLKTRTSGVQIPFWTNSGVIVTCTEPTFNIYVDLENPVCSFEKSNTGTTAGVTVDVTCDEPASPYHGEQSGCVTSGDDQGTHTGVKTDQLFFISDNAGNQSRCSVQIYTQVQKRTYTCNGGYSCPAAGCARAGYCVCSTGTDHGCFNSKQEGIYCIQMDYHNFQSNCQLGRWWCDWTTYNYCYDEDICGCAAYNTSIPTCGCASWNTPSAWENVDSCTEGLSNNNRTYTECRTLYS